MPELICYATKCKCDILCYWQKFPILVQKLKPNRTLYKWDNARRKWHRKECKWEKRRHTGKRSQKESWDHNFCYRQSIFCFVFKVLKKKGEALYNEKGPKLRWEYNGHKSLGTKQQSIKSHKISPREFKGKLTETPATGDFISFLSAHVDHCRVTKK